MTLNKSKFGTLLAALALAGLTLPAAAAIPDTERAVLEAIYTQTDGPNWTDNSNWMSGDPCSNNWEGVWCSPTENHVTEIRLNDNNLSGTLPDLSALTRLSAFRANNNNLSGPIPDLSGFSNLFDFIVNQNNLSGPIPPLPSSISQFNAADNSFSGPMPADLSGFAGMTYFNVSGNNLTGTIPALPAAIEMFYVDGNNLTGSPAAAPPTGIDDANLCPNFMVPSADASINTAWTAIRDDGDWSTECDDPAAAPDLFTVTTTVAGGGGSVWPSAPQTGIAHGVATSFRVLPDSGYAVDGVSTASGDCAASLSADKSYVQTDAIEGDCTLEVRFKREGVPPNAVAAVPTLGEWALLLLAGLLGLIGVRRLAARGH